MGRVRVPVWQGKRLAGLGTCGRTVPSNPQLRVATPKPFSTNFPALPTIAVEGPLQPTTPGVLESTCLEP